jgi:hypothetical protein
MPLALLTLPATATAFLHCVINKNHAPRDTIFTIQAAKDPNSSRINKLLMEKQQELLSDTSKLQEQHPQSVVAADNEVRDALTTEQMVREALLSTRLPLPFLHRTKLGPSKINGAGRGLFAAENIAEGEVITCYPGDALLCEMPSLNDFNENELNENEEEYEDNFDEKDEYIDEVVLWGAHVSTNDRLDDDAAFDGTESTPPLTAYAASVDDYYSVMGHPSLDDNPAYYGHFANDGAGQLALEKSNSPNNIQAALELGLDTEEAFSVEESIALYVLKSLEVANAKHQSLDVGELHLLTVATRDIEEGEEIYVTYGPDYWAGYDS